MTELEQKAQAFIERHSYEYTLLDLLVKFAEQQTTELKEENILLNNTNKGLTEIGFCGEELKQAKEILKEYLEWIDWKHSDCPTYKSICKKAEAFVKEEE